MPENAFVLFGIISPLNLLNCIMLFTTIDCCLFNRTGRMPACLPVCLVACLPAYTYQCVNRPLTMISNIFCTSNTFLLSAHKHKHIHSMVYLYVTFLNSTFCTQPMQNKMVTNYYLKGNVCLFLNVSRLFVWLAVHCSPFTLHLKYYKHI